MVRLGGSLFNSNCDDPAFDTSSSKNSVTGCSAENEVVSASESSIVSVFVVFVVVVIVFLLYMSVEFLYDFSTTSVELQRSLMPPLFLVF